MTDPDSGTQLRRSGERNDTDRVDTRLYALIVLATGLGVGHHIDHLVRGNHLGWPLIPEVTAFTYSLAFYPVIAVGLYLTLRGRVGAGYWVVVSVAGFLMVTTSHFGPLAVEPPQDIVGPYENVYVGYLALVWLLGFVGALLIATGYATSRWRWIRRVADR